MARHGNSKSQKRISASKALNIARKEYAWTIKASPGSHSSRLGVPLGIVLREMLGIAGNAKEARAILNKRLVSVDGVIRTSIRQPVGLFDAVALSGMKKYYRLLLDKKGRFIAKEIPAKNSGFKLVRVTGKKLLKGKKTQLSTNDGRSFVIAKEKAGIGDTLKIGIPEQKIEGIFELEKGNVVFVFTGKRTGTIAHIKDVVPGTMKRGKLVKLRTEGEEEFETVADNVFVVGKEKPEAELE